VSRSQTTHIAARGIHSWSPLPPVHYLAAARCHSDLNRDSWSAWHTLAGEAKLGASMLSTVSSPFEVASFQVSLVNQPGIAPSRPYGSSSSQAYPSAPLSTGHLTRQMSLVGLDSCTRERVRQQQQMQQQQQQQMQHQELSQGGASENLQSQLSQQLSQHNPSTKVPAFALRAAPRRLELSQNLSQEFLS